MSDMKIRVVPSDVNPDRPFLVEIKSADGKWTPFGNEVSRDAADKTVDMLIGMYGFTREI
jgi:hypothetical protein